MNVILPDSKSNTTEIINGKGNIIWTVPDNYTEGNYTIKVSYLGDDRYKPYDAEGKVNIIKNCSQRNNIEVLPILSADNLVMKYMDGSQFKARLVDGQGKAYPNQTVTFNIQGVFYERVTDSDGVAKLNIRLMAGEYIITSSYNGCNITNTIKITA